MKGSRNFVNSKKVSPRLSLLVAIDNFGAIYMSLTQVNTNEDVFQLFLAKLAAQLDIESPGWSTNTYWIFDGAKYHKGDATLDRMKALGINTIITGPYGFLGSPCELVFGYLKQIDLNPYNHKTGKKVS